MYFNSSCLKYKAFIRNYKVRQSFFSWSGTVGDAAVLELVAFGTLVVDCTIGGSK